MPAEHPIRNPAEMFVTLFSDAASDAGAAVARRPRPRAAQAAPAVRRISRQALWDALAEGVRDLGASRADVLFIGVIYPVAGLLLASLAFDQDLLPLIFPLVSGFALLGPVAAIGLYEISRRREQGLPAAPGDALSVLRSPRLGSILALGAVLLALFLLWIGAAYLIYAVTLGPAPPASASAFLREAVSTGAGWTMIGVGIGVGFLFALAAFAVSVVSFPMLLDRDVTFDVAIATSVRAVAANPGPMALWGLIVAGALAAGSLPALVGLIFVMPVLGHATWRLYRAVIA
jgi:uncharacterized membrane protein